MSFYIPGKINITECGKRVNIYNHVYGPFIRNNYIIELISEGFGQLEYNGKSFNIGKNQLFVMFQGYNISYVVNKNIPWTVRWINFFGEQAEYLINQLGVTPENPILSVPNMNEIENLMNVIIEKADSKLLSDKIDCYSLFYHLFSILCKESSIIYKENYVEKAIYFMSYNYEYDISISDVIKYVNINRCYFSQLFKVKYGVSPMRWLIDLRIKKAKEMLILTDMSVKEIACKVGIFDQLYFSRFFKKECGITPSAYRELNKK